MWQMNRKNWPILKTETGKPTRSEFGSDLGWISDQTESGESETGFESKPAGLSGQEVGGAATTQRPSACRVHGRDAHLLFFNASRIWWMWWRG